MVPASTSLFTSSQHFPKTTGNSGYKDLQSLCLHPPHLPENFPSVTFVFLVVDNPLPVKRTMSHLLTPYFQLSSLSKWLLGP